MSSGDGAGYRLTPRAVPDLDAAWRFSAENLGIAQADRHIDDLVRVFDLIAEMPTLAPERGAFEPPVRIHVHGSHLVVYRTSGGPVSILRVLGGQQDWLSILRMADL
ncbi:type II toxin-antitoxin system RelE/ParE family toxin [Marinibaculum pumilum]|uniref:Type II toxin-antitoxin system RelE/ParE family toxin n=1 Tax=Marinibaculum pumilum TaxID=1766165 RepID=A0ABV7KUJ3_9PROT